MSGETKESQVHLSNKVYLYGIPMPISVNAAYANNPIPGRMGRCKTKKYRDYETAMKEWWFKNVKTINQARITIANMVRQGYVLNLEYDFFFHHSSIFTSTKKAKNPMKRNDTANRLKVLDDELSKYLQVDDSYFWHGSFTKIAKVDDEGKGMGGRGDLL